MDFRNCFRTVDDVNAYIAYVLRINKIPSDNIFFSNTPNFLAFFSEYDNSLMHKPASEISDCITRTVIVEKCKQSKKFNCYFHRKPINGDRIKTKPLSSSTYGLTWKESNYGEEHDCFEALKFFLKCTSHLAVFLYVDIYEEMDFFEKIQKTKMIRAVTVNSDLLVF